MSAHRSPLLGTGRLTVVLLAAAAAVSAYPWQAGRERWVLGVGFVVAAAALVRWRGVPVTTTLWRWIALHRSAKPGRRVLGASDETRVTAVVGVAAPAQGPDVLPLALIARYLDRYGLTADAIRVTSREVGEHADGRERTTWIGLTFSAVDNLVALQARSPEIPLSETAGVVARRLADHLRESGWVAGVAEPEHLPGLDLRESRETWHGVVGDEGDHLAAYRLALGPDTPDVLTRLWSHPTLETWTVLEVTGSGEDQTLALATAFRTDARPAGAPLVGLIPQPGNQRAALEALDLLSVRRLDGHAVGSGDVLSRLSWPSSTARRLPVGSVSG
ncbi:type VII secretion protein EccE [Mycolicibacter minnesotensis]